MEQYQAAITQIRQVLADNPKGLSITDIAEKVGVNRNAVAKYMDILQVQGAVDGYRVGTSKLYFLTSRLPSRAVQAVCSRPLLLIDRDGIVTDTNKAFTDVLGISRENVIGKEFGALPVKPDEIGQNVPALRTALRGTEQRTTGRVTHAAGREHAATLLFEPVVFENGKPGAALIIDEHVPPSAGLEIHGAFSDILALLDDEQEYVVRYAPDGAIRFVNETYCRAVGKAKEDLIGRPFRPLVSDEDAMRIQKHFDSLTSKNPSAVLEFRAVMADGEVRWQRWKNRALFDERGQLTGYQSCGLDITELVALRAELLKIQETIRETVIGQTAELREVNRQLYGEIARRDKTAQNYLAMKNIMDNAFDLVFWVSSNDRIRYTSKRAADLLEYTLDELASAHFSQLLPDYGSDHWNNLLETARSGGPINVSPATMITKSRRKVPVEIILRPVKYHGDEIVCCFARALKEMAVT